MARTDNTAPWRIREADRPFMSYYYVRRFTSSTEVGMRAREHNRRDRHDARTALRRGGDPEPRQTRSRALWDSF